MNIEQRDLGPAARGAGALPLDGVTMQVIISCTYGKAVAGLCHNTACTQRDLTSCPCPGDWDPGSEETLTPYQPHASSSVSCGRTADELLQELRRVQATAAEQVQRLTHVINCNSS